MKLARVQLALVEAAETLGGAMRMLEVEMAGPTGAPSQAALRKCSAVVLEAAGAFGSSEQPDGEQHPGSADEMSHEAGATSSSGPPGPKLAAKQASGTPRGKGSVMGSAACPAARPAPLLRRSSTMPSFDGEQKLRFKDAPTESLQPTA
eukprot:6622937-Prymnesium_polylepis.1